MDHGVAAAAAATEKLIKVLVVDDSPIDRMLVERTLQKSCNSNGESFHVIAVDSGKKAMELLGVNQTTAAKSCTTYEPKIDIVLTDYCMPEMTGYDLLKAIKEQSFIKPIPVVIMSSEGEPQRIDRCLMAGAADFIIKPFQTEDIHCLRSHSGRTPPKLQSNSAAKSEKSSPEMRARIAGLPMVQQRNYINMLYFLGTSHSGSNLIFRCQISPESRSH